MTAPIKHEPPPNIEAIRAKFPISLMGGIVFAYSPDIYVPSGHPLPEWIIAHEEVHVLRQGDNPAEWWHQYIEDEAFRFEEELAAHKAEYRMVCRLTNDRETQNKMLSHIAAKLIDPIYAYTKLLTPIEARKMVKS